jgi:hypothetical protein
VTTWDDALVEVCEMYELTVSIIRQNAAEPETEYTKMNEENLKAILVCCNNIIADINEKIRK